MPPDSSSAFDMHLMQSMQTLQDMRGSHAMDLFLFYCQDDVPKNPKDKVHPKTVADDLKQEGHKV